MLKEHPLFSLKNGDDDDVFVCAFVPLKENDFGLGAYAIHSFPFIFFAHCIVQEGDLVAQATALSLLLSLIHLRLLHLALPILTQTFFFCLYACTPRES